MLEIKNENADNNMVIPVSRSGERRMTDFDSSITRIIQEHLHVCDGL